VAPNMWVNHQRTRQLDEARTLFTSHYTCQEPLNNYVTLFLVSFNPSPPPVTNCHVDHITPVLRDLHWPPIRQRIQFKLAMMVFKCLHGPASTSCCQSLAERRWVLLSSHCSWTKA